MAGVAVESRMTVSYALLGTPGSPASAGVWGRPRSCLSTEFQDLALSLHMASLGRFSMWSLWKDSRLITYHLGSVEHKSKSQMLSSGFAPELAAHHFHQPSVNLSSRARSLCEEPAQKCE